MLNLHFHVEIYTQLRYNKKKVGCLFAFILYKS